MNTSRSEHFAPTNEACVSSWHLLRSPKDESAAQSALIALSAGRLPMPESELTRLPSRSRLVTPQAGSVSRLLRLWNWSHSVLSPVKYARSLRSFIPPRLTVCVLSCQSV